MWNLIFGAGGAVMIAVVSWALYKLATTKGANDVLQADAAATAKGTQQATKEITKTTTIGDTERTLDKGEF